LLKKFSSNNKELEKLDIIGNPDSKHSQLSMYKNIICSKLQKTQFAASSRKHRNKTQELAPRQTMQDQLARWFLFVAK
jgi:hypothetical protein